MSDPTGTAKLRRSFLAEGNRRLSQLRSQTHAILVKNDYMQARTSAMLAAFPGQSGHAGDLLPRFAEWFERTANSLLTGHPWWERHLDRAYASGATAAARIPGFVAGEQHPAPIPSVYRELVAREFQGIVDAMVQQVARAAATGALTKLPPLTLYQQVLAVLRKVGGGRLKAAVNFVAVQLHNAARLSVFRQAGVTRLGIIPERLELKRPQRLRHDHAHDHLLRDLSAYEVAQAAVEQAARKLADAQLALAQAEVAAEQAQAKLEVAQARVETETTEVATVEGEVAGFEASRDAIAAEDPGTPNHAARLREAERKVTQAYGKLQRANDRLQAAQDALDAAQAEVARTADDVDEARAAVDEAEAELESAQEKIAGYLNVQTAEDDRVCPECIALAAAGPYSPDEAEGLLPLHVHCRCTWVPAA